MKVLFSLFKEHDIRYVYKNDFNRDGEFHGVVKSVWEEEKKLTQNLVPDNTKLQLMN